MKIVGIILIAASMCGFWLLMPQPYMNTKVPTLQNQYAWQTAPQFFAVPGDECQRPVWDRDPRMHCPDDPHLEWAAPSLPSCPVKVCYSTSGTSWYRATDGTIFIWDGKQWCKDEAIITINGQQVRVIYQVFCPTNLRCA